VVLAVVDDQGQLDVREAGQERLLGGVLLGRGVAAGVDDELAALGEGVGVQLVERPGLLGAAVSRRQAHGVPYEVGTAASRPHVQGSQFVRYRHAGDHAQVSGVQLQRGREPPKE
jgi:hypothetical protein